MIQIMIHLLTDFISRMISPKEAHERYESALIKRRNKRFLRKILIVISSFILMMFCISAISAMQETQNIIIARKSIAIGEKITSSHVQSITVPKHEVFQQVLRSYSSDLNLTALCNIKSGMPILTNEISKSPNIPKGYTTIDVTLSSANQALKPGENISIAFAKSPIDINNTNKNNHKEIENNNSQTTSEKRANFTVLRDVLVIKTPDSKHIATLAMRANDALELLNAQSDTPTGAIIAIKQ